MAECQGGTEQEGQERNCLFIWCGCIWKIFSDLTDAYLYICECLDNSKACSAGTAFS